jgi:ABC-2 type transport system permease protein/sodium transport system permease protein
VLSGTASWSNAVVTVGTTILYSILALTMAARFFGTANVLYGQDQGIGTLWKRPAVPRNQASASLGMLCLALLFPASFLWQGVMARTTQGLVDPTQGGEGVSPVLDGDLVEKQLWLAALGLTLVFLVIPWLISAFHRIRFRSGYGLAATSVMAVVAAILMGLGFGPLLLQAIAWSAQLLEQMGISNESLSEALVQRGEEQVARLKTAPLWLILFSMAIVPAVCEELFFRGLLFQSFRANMSPWKTILATGLLFGVFHLISASGLAVSRLLPTTVMGILLGWVCYRSGSVIPGMLMHGLHNAITVCFAYFRDDLVEAGWITQQQSNVPWPAILLGAICAGLGMLILWLRPPTVWQERRRTSVSEPVNL